MIGASAARVEMEKPAAPVVEEKKVGQTFIENNIAFGELDRGVSRTVVRV